MIPKITKVLKHKRKGDEKIIPRPTHCPTTKTTGKTLGKINTHKSFTRLKIKNITMVTSKIAKESE